MNEEDMKAKYPASESENEAGHMKIYTVYYATKEHAHYGAKDTLFSLDTINETHRLVRVVEATSLDHVFYMMQGENWTPSGLPDGVKHTSMSVGDCVQDENNWYECLPIGWRLMNEKSEDERGGELDTNSLAPPIITNNGAIFVNPGTGKVNGATEENAIANMKVFVEDCFDGLTYQRTPDMDYGDGRYSFSVAYQGHSLNIQMPGWPIENVRYTGADHQNIWNFPRLYVEDSSWVWKFAVMDEAQFLEYFEDDDEN